MKAQVLTGTECGGAWILGSTDLAALIIASTDG
jgi:hypothetical protein